MCKKLYATNVAAIDQTLAQIDEENVGRAVKYLSAAQRVYCFGQGGSLVIAMEAWARFITAAPQFQCIEDSHMQAMAAALSTPDDVILFFPIPARQRICWMCCARRADAAQRSSW